MTLPAAVKVVFHAILFEETRARLYSIGQIFVFINHLTFILYIINSHSYMHYLNLLIPL